MTPDQLKQSIIEALEVRQREIEKTLEGLRGQNATPLDSALLVRGQGERVGVMYAARLISTMEFPEPPATEHPCPTCGAQLYGGLCKNYDPEITARRIGWFHPDGKFGCPLECDEDDRDDWRRPLLPLPSFVGPPIPVTKELGWREVGGRWPKIVGVLPADAEGHRWESRWTLKPFNDLWLVTACYDVVLTDPLPLAIAKYVAQRLQAVLDGSPQPAPLSENDLVGLILQEFPDTPYSAQNFMKATRIAKEILAAPQPLGTLLTAPEVETLLMEAIPHSWRNGNDGSLLPEYGEGLRNISNAILSHNHRPILDALLARQEKP